MSVTIKSMRVTRTIALSMFFCAGPVVAQDMPIIDMSAFTNSINLQAAQNLSDQVGQSYMEQNGAELGPNQATQTNSAQLNYTPSKTLRQKNLQSFVNKTRSRDPVGANQMQQIFASTDVIHQMDVAIRPAGLSVNNVADAYTVWWITAWEAVHRRDMGNNVLMIQAVKNQATNALLSTPQFISATNTQKQEIAEVFLVQAALIDGVEEAYANDPKKLDALARAVNQGAMAMDRDLDLTKMTLTPNGFVPRSGGRSDAGDVSGDGSQLAATEEGGSNLALYAVAGTGLLAGVFALGKGLAKKG